MVYPRYTHVVLIPTRSSKCKIIIITAAAAAAAASTLVTQGPFNFSRQNGRRPASRPELRRYVLVPQRVKPVKLTRGLYDVHVYDDVDNRGTDKNEKNKKKKQNIYNINSNKPEAYGDVRRAVALKTAHHVPTIRNVSLNRNK